MNGVIPDTRGTHSGVDRGASACMKVRVIPLLNLLAPEFYI